MLRLSYKKISHKNNGTLIKILYAKVLVNLNFAKTCFGENI